jgi:uncharacterized membrane protein YdbT with pleckstrin-like domain
MDDRSVLQYTLPAGIFLVAIVGMLVWQTLRLISRGGLDALGLIRLAVNLFLLGVMCWVTATALSMWT